ncbi:class I SAM-dependent methyltransferase [Candidatus Woesearchaeota archaeon]|nr:class I SAM-dependent methyltransferase [Candidatus Woesearchaeota archaeon]MCF7900703.1 class I SAM-dependent methyltransferase [Candidatus Woesearchaeota archaeon]MCF8013224.1 class I SAM-dependent methyltransferase [Candidatus Woesearchaeota archaeon]
MQEETTKYYDGIASGYNNLYGEEQREKFKIIKTKINLEKNQTLLDIGCGSGISSEFFDCNIQGIDPSSELIKIAKQNHPEHQWIEGSGEEISEKYSEKKFDFIICISSAHHIKNIKKLIKDIKKLSKPNQKTKYCFSLLKNSQRNEEIISEIEKEFKITEKILGKKDIIIFFL